MTVNLDKTKVIVFNINQVWVTRSEPRFFFGQEKVALYMILQYVEVTFTGARVLPMAGCLSQLSHGYAALGVLERQCART